MTVHAWIPTGELDGLQGTRPPSHPQPRSAYPVSLPRPVPLLKEFGLHSNDLDPELDSICVNFPSLTVPSQGLPVGIEHRTKPTAWIASISPLLLARLQVLKPRQKKKKKNQTKKNPQKGRRGWCSDSANPTIVSEVAVLFPSTRKLFLTQGHTASGRQNHLIPAEAQPPVGLRLSGWGQLPQSSPF